jgi:hypothetical protein
MPRTSAVVTLAIAVAGSVQVAAPAQLTTSHSAQTASPPYELTIDGQQYFVVEYPEPNSHVASFNASLKARKIPRVETCTLLIDLPVGTAHGNHSFGALCRQRYGHKIRSVFVCNDEMVGHFALDVVPNNASKDALITFIATNCYGG